MNISLTSVDEGDPVTDRKFKLSGGIFGAGFSFPPLLTLGLTRGKQEWVAIPFPFALCCDVRLFHDMINYFSQAKKNVSYHYCVMQPSVLVYLKLCSGILKIFGPQVEMVCMYIVVRQEYLHHIRSHSEAISS